MSPIAITMPVPLALSRLAGILARSAAKALRYEPKRDGYPVPVAGGWTWPRRVRS